MDIPSHQITGTGKGLLTSTDGFTGVNSTTTYMGGASFTGEIPNYQFDFKRFFAAQDLETGGHRSGHQHLFAFDSFGGGSDLCYFGQ